jgi:tRNA G10  N-methylase Trm11
MYIAELERVFGGKSIKVLSSQAVSIKSGHFDIQRLGSVPKAGNIIAELSKSDWHKVSQKIVQYYGSKWSSFEGKITLGISVYGFDINAREVQKSGIILKQKLKKSGVSLRLVPNPKPDLNTAISHHNKLGLSPNKIELLIVRASSGNVTIAESTGSQNITAYANRDQMRPKRDTFVGMLPPKLAQIMINLAIESFPNNDNYISVSSRHLEPEFNKAPGLLVDAERSSDAKNGTQSDDQDKRTILDPFCGTGVILQEAALMGYSVYGTDLSEKMIRYSRDNLNWLAESHHIKPDWYLQEGDAMNAKWRKPIDTVVSEVYLGQPFSAPPSPAKLDEVKQNCDRIITEFLKNLAGQIEPGTPLCIAVPAWRDKDGNFTHLPFISTIARLGYKPFEFTNISQNDLLYYRENQIVARELLVLTRT